MAEQLSDLELEVLDCLADAAEPTWLVAKHMPQLAGDRDALEDVLSDLWERDLVIRTREPSGEPDVPYGECWWWDLTAAGRKTLGLPQRRR